MELTPLFKTEYTLKYEKVIEKVRLLKPGEYALYFYSGHDIKQERQRIATNIRYHVELPAHHRFAFKCVIVDNRAAISIHLLTV